MWYNTRIWNLSSWPFLSVEVSGIKYSHIAVQKWAPSFPQLLSAYKTETLSPLNTDYPFSPLLAPGSHHCTSCLCEFDNSKYQIFVELNRICLPLSVSQGFPGDASGKEPTCQCKRERNADSIPGSGRFHRGGHGNPLQRSCPENPMDRGAWRATAQGVAKSQTRLSTHAHKSSRDSFLSMFFLWTGHVSCLFVCPVIFVEHRTFKSNNVVTLKIRFSPFPRVCWFLLLFGSFFIFISLML